MFFDKIFSQYFAHIFVKILSIFWACFSIFRHIIWIFWYFFGQILCSYLPNSCAYKFGPYKSPGHKCWWSRTVSPGNRLPWKQWTGARGRRRAAVWWRLSSRERGNYRLINRFIDQPRTTVKPLLLSPPPLFITPLLWEGGVENNYPHTYVLYLSL